MKLPITHMRIPNRVTHAGKRFDYDHFQVLKQSELVYDIVREQMEYVERVYPQLEVAWSEVRIGPEPVGVVFYRRWKN